jgi:hypothetical protein
MGDCRADLKPGDLLFLTKAFEDYFREKHPESKIYLINRLAKLEEIIDWNTPKGQQIKQARLTSGKWKDLPLEENRYIVSIYYHDIAGRQAQKGVAERGVAMFRCHPVTGQTFFEKVPDWIYREILKQCETFGIEKREVEPTLEEKVQKFASETSAAADAAIIKSVSKKAESHEENPCEEEEKKEVPNKTPQDTKTKGSV